MFRATYRLQLHKNFQFTDAAQVTKYLEDLGISHLYLSPILESREGSLHGYDGIDPTQISSERGGDEGLRELLLQIEKTKNLDGAILDIVPNHLAAHWKNPAWWDVLLNGPESQYWNSFDIRARSERGDLKIVIPVLGRSRRSSVNSRELILDVHPKKGLVLRYWENLFPVHPKSYASIFAELAEDVRDSESGHLHERLLKISSLALKNHKQAHHELIRWIDSDSKLESSIRQALELLPVKVVEAVLNLQNYWLDDWRIGSRNINYRRFFDINDLAAIRVEDPKTFSW
jgi:(1->4)-alpha-D-glucan 1-alpha-D-glucosylmutase